MHFIDCIQIALSLSRLPQIQGDDCAEDSIDEINPIIIHPWPAMGQVRGFSAAPGESRDYRGESKTRGKLQ